MSCPTLKWIALLLQRNNSMKYLPCSIRNLARGAPIPLVTPVIKAYFPFHLSIMRSVPRFLKDLCAFPVPLSETNRFSKITMGFCFKIA